MVDLSKLKETINELMTDKNLDAKTLANSLGLEVSTITRYRRGERAPTVQNIILIADYFKCTTDFLLGREEISSSKEFKTCPLIKDRIAALPDEFNLSSYAFCRKAKITDASFYEWKKGKHIPSLDNIVKIADTFECSVDFILGREK